MTFLCHHVVRLPCEWHIDFSISCKHWIHLMGVPRSRGHHSKLRSSMRGKGPVVVVVEGASQGRR